ncbi:MAG: sensor histidine kinase [Gemmatimonadales bacterium]
MPLPKRVRPWMIVSAAWLGPAVLGAVDQVAQARIWGDKPPSLSQILFTSGDWFLYAFLTPFVFAISRRWPLARPRLARRATLHLGISLLFCVAWATAGTLLKAGLALAFDPGAVAGAQFLQKAVTQYLSWVFTTLPFGVAVYLCMVGIEHAIRYFVEARDREVQVARLSEQLSGARFAALQAQLNPHFLFNTLNTITVLVRDGNKTGATRMVEQLSDILRRTLSPSRANEVTLGEELELVRQYLAIEQARFSDRLRPAFDVDDALLGAAVPGFALQHLAENAIRHGIAKRPDAGQMRVAARRDGATLELSVTDDGPGIDAVVPGVSHGIENTRERLRALHGERASLVVANSAGGGTVATLRIPYRELSVEAGVATR